MDFRRVTDAHACRSYILDLYTGGIRYNLFEIYYFGKLHAPRARARRARTRRAREGRQDESTVNNSASKLKIYEIHPVGNHLLFPSMGRGTCESKYPRRKVENNNDPI